MKTILFSFLFAFVASFLSAQVPQATNYQAVARSISGSPITNTTIGVRFQILQGTSNGTSVYTETHTATTNNLGLFNLAIGLGTPVSGTFAGIDWSNFPYFLEVAIDPAGGSAYQLVGASEMYSVPYALRSSCNCSMIVDGDGDTWVETETSNSTNSTDADEIHMYLGGTPGTPPGANPKKAFVLRKNNAIGQNTVLEIFDAAGHANTFIGENAGNANTTGTANTVIGDRALRSNTTGHDNTAIGVVSLLYNTTGDQNTATGSGSLQGNTTGYGNTANGEGALQSNASGAYNTAVGLSTLSYNNGGSNTAIGKHAMFFQLTGNFNTASGAEALRGNGNQLLNTGSNNTASGYQALFANEGGHDNVAVGVSALHDNVSGYENVAVGTASLAQNKTGKNNTATGRNALAGNISGNDNTATGFAALVSNIGGTTNTANGIGALFTNDQGNYNTASGGFALYDNQTGHLNTAIGLDALHHNVTGSNNTAIGHAADVGLGNLNNSTAIGANAMVMMPDNMILGDNAVKVGIGISGRPNGPQNKLEIDAGAGSNASGLMFSQLNAATPASVPATSNVLSVDAAGNVILVPCCSSGGGSGIFGPCSSVSPMTSNSGANLNGNNFFFQDLSTPNANGNVGIGQTCSSPLLGKLHVTTNQTGSGYTHGIYADTRNNNNTAISIGMRSLCIGTASQNYGLFGEAHNGLNNYAVFGSSASTLAAGNNYGVYGVANNAPKNYAGYFSSTSTISLFNYGVYAEASGATNDNWSFYCIGKSFQSTGASWTTSDRKFKTNIADISGASWIIQHLNPKTYYFNTAEFPFLLFPSEKQYGLIADEVANVLPEAVTDVHHPERKDVAGKEISPALDFKALNYNAFIPILIQGIKEQQAQIEALKLQNDQMNQQAQYFQAQLDALRAEMQTFRAAIEKQAAANGSNGMK